MATVLSLASVGIGDMELFMPSPPCLVVNTFYVDGEPESSVSYVWQDPETGELRSELAYMQPVAFETALAWAEAHAPTRSVERIHTRHAAKIEPRPATKRKPARKATAKREAAPKKAASKRRAAPKKKAATRKAPARKPTRKPPAKRRAARKAKR